MTGPLMASSLEEGWAMVRACTIKNKGNGIRLKKKGKKKMHCDWGSSGGARRTC